MLTGPGATTPAPGLFAAAILMTAPLWGHSGLPWSMLPVALGRLHLVEPLTADFISLRIFRPLLAILFARLPIFKTVRSPKPVGQAVCRDAVLVLATLEILDDTAAVWACPCITISISALPVLPGTPRLATGLPRMLCLFFLDSSFLCSWSRSSSRFRSRSIPHARRRLRSIHCLFSVFFLGSSFSFLETAVRAGIRRRSHG